MAHVVVLAWLVGASAVAAQAPTPRLDPETREPLTLHYRNSRLVDVCRGVAQLVGIQIHITENAISAIRVTIELEDVSLEKALEEISRLANVDFEVVDSKTVVLRRASQATKPLNVPSTATTNPSHI